VLVEIDLRVNNMNREDGFPPGQIIEASPSHPEETEGDSEYKPLLSLYLHVACT
jgi:hypothetical protein